MNALMASEQVNHMKCGMKVTNVICHDAMSTTKPSWPYQLLITPSRGSTAGWQGLRVA